MMKQFTTMRIAKFATADTEIDSQHLTFKYWSKGDKHRVYIVDYKRRTLGYIDLDNNNAVEINDRHGNTQADIDYAVATFMDAVSDDEAQDNAYQAAPQQDINASRKANNHKEEKTMKGTEKQIKWAEEIKAEFIERVNHFVKEARRAEAIELINAKTDAAWWIEHRDIFELCKVGKAMRFVQTGKEPEEYVSITPHAFN